MKYLYHVLTSLLLLGLVACGTQTKEQQEEKTEETQQVRDPHSFARPNEVVVKHLDLDLKVDFDNKVLNGVATLDLERKEGNKLMLDTRLLTIEKVTDGKDELVYTLHDELPFVGSALEIDLKDNTSKVAVYYKTSPEAPAIQWLASSQTAGKKHPFLFTQSQAILARSWVPIQDSPGIRFTYDAKVTVPTELLALMSAENPQEKNVEGVYNFKQAKPIPAYLLALAVGDIEFAPIGKRTGVYAEPSMLKKTKYELEGMGEMLIAAEKLYGSYKWGRYDVLMLPPSFPFGGMENPMLTFATPTIIAGDRSLTSLIAHELAHSWSGNLVTNATWNDFWLNEGFTVYFELRIMEEVYGKSFSDMLALISRRDLDLDLEDLKYGDDTKLKLDLDGRDPDEGMNSIAYDKGFHFLLLIEQTVGREKWDAFLKQYFNEFAFKTVTTEAFLAYLKTNLLDKVEGAENTINPEAWVYNGGLPDNCPVVASERYNKVDETVKKFVGGTKAAELETKDWIFYQEWEHFLSELPDDLTTEQMTNLDKQFKFTENGNNEILFQWLMHVIQSEYKPAYGKLEQFLMTVGRRKFIAPLYREMAKKEVTKEMAKKIYEKARGNYHYVSVATIDEILK
ncbi:M1 family metallopeptidase [Limibacter armeniacum]|uniref:M1 family metallopeptidase n=1 Tax=Limibacter armeniacum TaxID=466084 RepID=UPI002FE6A433